MQPFERPALQKGYGLHLPDGIGLNRVWKFDFTYTEEEAKEIFSKYNEQIVLWHKDELIAPTIRISNKTDFALKVFGITWQRYPVSGLTKSQCIKILRKHGFGIKPQNHIEAFSEEDNQKLFPVLRERWESYSKKLVSRKILEIEDSPGHSNLKIIKKQKDCVSTAYLADTLILRIAMTGKTGPDNVVPCLVHPNLNINDLLLE